MLKDKKKVRFLVVSLFLLAFAFSCFALFLNYRGRMERLGSESLDRLSSAVEAALDVYGRMVEMVFDGTARQPEVRVLYHRAQHEADPQQRAFWRGCIRNRLEPAFDRLSFYDIRLLNLVLPDGTVFLRMHSPDLYGDNVLPYSSLQRIALERRAPARGFQVGKTVGAFRFSFPLFLGSEFLGSAEYGLSSSALLELLQSQFPGHYFLLLRSETLQFLESEERSRQYIQSRYAKGFYEEVQAQEGQLSPKELDPEVLERLQKEAERLIGKKLSSLFGGEPFFFFVNAGRQSYVFTYLPIKGPSGDFLGYIAGINRNPSAEELLKIYLHFAFLLLLFFAMAALLLYQAVRSHSKLVDEAMFDSLTGALKKAEFEALAKSEADRAKRYRFPLSVILFDLDGFKSVNDLHGHIAGDSVLKTLAHAIRGSIRGTDRFFRWGGDEFLLVLPHTGKEGARKLAEKLLQLAGRIEAGPVKGVSLSLGIAELEEDDTDLGTVLVRADEALYRAKEKGKSQVSD